MGPRWVKMVPRALKRVPGGPEMGTRWSQMAGGGAQDGPRWAKIAARVKTLPEERSKTATVAKIRQNL